MAKIKKDKKIKKVEKKARVRNVSVEIDVKKAAGEEEPEKEGGTLSDGVLDAFEEVAPVDLLLLEEETVLAEDDDDDDDEIDSGDYKPLDEW